MSENDNKENEKKKIENKESDNKMSENDNKESDNKMSENDDKENEKKKINSILGMQFVNFLMSQKNKTDRQNLADDVFDLYSSFCKAGFNEEESLQLLIAMMQSLIDSMFAR